MSLYMHPRNESILAAVLRQLMRRQHQQQQRGDPLVGEGVLRSLLRRHMAAMRVQIEERESAAFTGATKLLSLDDAHALQKWNVKTVQGVLRELAEGGGGGGGAGGADGGVLGAAGLGGGGGGEKTVRFALKKEFTETLVSSFNELQEVYTQKNKRVEQDPPAQLRETVEDRPIENIDELLASRIEERRKQVLHKEEEEREEEGHVAVVD